MCIRDRYGVVYDNGMKLEQAYDRKHLPPIWMAANSILELKIRATGEDDPKKQEWVQLPASQIKLERAMLRAGIAPNFSSVFSFMFFNFRIFWG